MRLGSHQQAAWRWCGRGRKQTESSASSRSWAEVPAATARGPEQLEGALCCRAPIRDGGGRCAGKGRVMDSQELPPAPRCQEGHYQGRQLLPRAGSPHLGKMWRQEGDYSRFWADAHREMPPWRESRGGAGSSGLGLLRDGHEAVALLIFLPEPQRVLVTNDGEGESLTEPGVPGVP